MTISTTSPVHRRSRRPGHHAVVRVIADTHRHAGHADIIRELIDGAVGMNKGNDSMPPGDSEWWENYRSRLERAAQEADRDT